MGMIWDRAIRMCVPRLPPADPLIGCPADQLLTGRVDTGETDQLAFLHALRLRVLCRKTYE